MKKNIFFIFAVMFLSILFPFSAFADSITPTPVPQNSSPLSDFPTGKYAGYYYYAKSKLFDGVDFFTKGTSYAFCPSLPTDQQMEQWGISLVGHGITISQNLKNAIYTTICKNYQSQTFLSLTKTQTQHITIFIEASSGVCGGAAITDHDTGNIHLCLNGNENQHEIQFYLSHELGHVIQDRNPSIETAWSEVFDLNNLLYTINCTGNWGITQQECFSDALALYTVYGVFDSPDFVGFAPFMPLSSYSTYGDSGSKWYTYYQFMDAEVFGGTTFFPTATAANNALASAAIKLVQSIVANCPSPKAAPKMTYITNANYDCLKNNAQKLLPNLTQDQINDTLLAAGDGNLQCVTFARAAAAEAGFPLKRPTEINPKAPGNDAHDYQYVSEQGYVWYSKAQLKTLPTGVQPGDIAVFGPGPRIQDHIGIVSSIIGDGKTWFYLAEANGGSGLVDISSDRGVPYSATNNDFDGVFRLQ